MPQPRLPTLRVQGDESDENRDKPIAPADEPPVRIRLLNEPDGQEGESKKTNGGAMPFQSQRGGSLRAVAPPLQEQIEGETGNAPAVGVLGVDGPLDAQLIDQAQPKRGQREQGKPGPFAG